MKQTPVTFASLAIEELRAHAWPGNVRELQNCIERAVILTEGDTIHARHLSLSFRLSPQTAASDTDVSPWAQVDLPGTLAEPARGAIGEVERRKIEQTLKEAAGNRGKAAEVLQVSHKT